MIKSSPWGTVQDVTHVAEGIDFVSTASHGGYKLDRERNKKVPKYMRTKGGWYEEDVEAVVVISVFPEHFNEKQRESADKAFRDYFPGAYELFYKKQLGPEDSTAIAAEYFKVEHQNDYIVMSAWGSWHPKVPEGTVLVMAGRGGRTPKGGYPEDSAFFFVPSWEYDQRGPFGFVINEEAHEKTDVRP